MPGGEAQFAGERSRRGPHVRRSRRRAGPRRAEREARARRAVLRRETAGQQEVRASLMPSCGGFELAHSRLRCCSLAPLLAGGKREQTDRATRPPVSAGTGGVNGAGAAVAGSGAGAAVDGSGAGSADADSDLSNSCPQAASNHSCPMTEIDIRFTRDAVGPRTGVWVEPLQIPDYPQGSPADPPEVDPSKWDRSPLPAGACVLRIHGLSGACLQFSPLYIGTCAALAAPDAPHAIPISYYETGSCRQGIAPGCPSASASDRRNGNWWYLVARGEDTDLVVCATECSNSFGSEKRACLRVAGSG